MVRRRSSRCGACCHGLIGAPVRSRPHLPPHRHRLQAQGGSSCMTSMPKGMSMRLWADSGPRSSTPSTPPGVGWRHLLRGRTAEGARCSRPPQNPSGDAPVGATLPHGHGVCPYALGLFLFTPPHQRTIIMKQTATRRRVVYTPHVLAERLAPSCDVRRRWRSDSTSCVVWNVMMQE